MLTKGDEYPIHQTPEPVALAGSDRNFYDRFFFNGYSPDGDVFFAAALGVYPHLNVMDGAFSVLRKGRQTSVHVSRALGMERMDTEVGPLSVEVDVPLQRIRLRLAPTEGVAIDGVFQGRHFPIEEPRFTHRQGPRMLIDCTRMTQNGRWTGSLEVDGEQLVSGEAGWQGTRDRSWGVRPIGAPDPQPLVPAALPQFFWLWAPVNLEGLSHFYHVNQDGDGAPWNTRAVAAPEGAGRDGLQHIAHPEPELEWHNGTRRLKRMTVRAGEHVTIYEPGPAFLMKGIGYGHPEYRHGLYRGDLAVDTEVLEAGTEDWKQPDTLHIQALSDVRYEGPLGAQSGRGVVEQLCLGPYAPMGWTGVLDA